MLFMVSCTDNSPSGPDWSQFPQNPDSEESTPEPEPTQLLNLNQSQAL